MRGLKKNRKMIIFFQHIQQKTFLGSRRPSALKMGLNRDNYTLISTQLFKRMMKIVGRRKNADYDVKYCGDWQKNAK